MTSNQTTMRNKSVQSIITVEKIPSNLQVHCEKFFFNFFKERLSTVRSTVDFGKSFDLFIKENKTLFRYNSRQGL